MKLNTKPLKFKCGLADGGGGAWRTLARHGYPHLVQYNVLQIHPIKVFYFRIRNLFEFRLQINRLKEAIEKLNSECDLLRSKELSSQEQSRKLQRQLRDLKEEHANAQQRETESFAKKHELEKQLVFLMSFFLYISYAICVLLEVF
jgi:hypothetical protein